MTAGQDSYWQMQTAERPLFPDLIWSRPENKRLAGKLLIVGGNIHGFSAVATSYSVALEAGIGSISVLLPDSLQKTVGKILEVGEFAPSTPSGSFGRQALSDLLSLSTWADAILFAGDFGRNSETAILLEQSIKNYGGQLTITQDALDYFTKAPQSIAARPETLIVASFSQLQKLAVNLKFASAFTYDMNFLKLIEVLHNFTEVHNLSIITKHLDTIFVATSGLVSTTKLSQDLEIWRVNFAAQAATWWLQNPNSTFEALSSSVIQGASG